MGETTDTAALILTWCAEAHGDMGEHPDVCHDHACERPACLAVHRIETLLRDGVRELPGASR